MLVHATCVALKHGRAWRALLLRGPSGAGKSDVALRLIEAGGRLVADDQTHLARAGRALIATPPQSLAGLIEVRGLGIVKLGRGQLLARAPLALLVDLVQPDRVERMPDPAREKVLGIDLPKIALAPFEASIATKLRLALARAVAA
jgi:serine kinase of HPr protein (carbohydrate metabolism regulator)